MSSATSREEAAARLRQVVASENFSEVRAALAEYRRHFDASVAAWPSDGPPPIELARESLDLMEWALRAARAARARTSQALNQVLAAQRYHRPAPPAATWKTEG
jgi:hypothetical protein